MSPKPPFRLDLTVWALRRLAINQMDRWDGGSYRRVLVLGGRPAELVVRQTGDDERPRLRVVLEYADHRPPGPPGPPSVDPTAGPAVNDAAEARRALRRLLGLDMDLVPFYHLAASDRRLDPLARRFVGMKPPRFPSVFEGVVNGIACQQLSLNVGITLLNRLCAAYGAACGEAHAFPLPQDLAKADVPSLRGFGFTTQKAQNIIGIARAVAGGELDLEDLNNLDDAAAEEALDRLKGVGRWTAQYVALRGLGRLDVFPADDVGSQNKLREWLSLEHRPDYDETTELLARFRPYRGFIYFHLLLNHLADEGLVVPSEEEGGRAGAGPPSRSPPARGSRRSAVRV